MCAGDKSRDLLTQAMIEAGWKYHTQVIDKPGVSVVDKPANGGAIIFSKWPILATSQYVYTKQTFCRRYVPARPRGRPRRVLRNTRNPRW